VFTPVSVTAAGKATGGSIAIAGGNLTPGSSDATLNTSITVGGMKGANVSGTISALAGTIVSPSYTITVTNGSITVTNNPVGNGDVMTLTGADVTGLAGTIAYNPLGGLSFVNEVATAGTLNFSPATLDATNNTGTLDSGGSSSATFPLVINLPSDLAGATVSGTLSITGGTLIQGSGALPASDYGVTLTGGSINFSGTANGAGQLNLPSVTATGLLGTITVTSGTVNTGANPTSAEASGSGGATFTATTLLPTSAASLSLTGTLNYSATNINIGKASLTVTPSTITIASMVFGQGQYYLPGVNATSFFPTPTGGDVTVGTALETFGHTATLVPSNDLLIYGGSDCSGGATCPNLTADSKAFYYFDNSATFNTTSGALNTSRALHTTTLLTDGTMLVAGGTTGLNPLNSAEIFNPLNQQYAPIASLMSNPRDLHTATLMTNGRVLIA